MSKLMKDMKFDEILNNRVDMERVDLDSVKPWITRQIIGMIKEEDEVLINYIYNQLEPKYPDPREIQSNLSGFLSFKNARIFISELWKQLISSMRQNNAVVDENKKNSIDKIKSFPRLGPTENKHSIIEINVEGKSVEKKLNRHYRSTSSRSESIPSQYNYRPRSRSNSKYKYDRRNRLPSRSKTKSSSRYTPYTRYSRYTDSYEARYSSRDSYSFRCRKSRKPSYSSTSSSSASVSGTSSIDSRSLSNIQKLDDRKKDMPRMICNSIRSKSDLLSVDSKSSVVYNEQHEYISVVKEEKFSQKSPILSHRISSENNAEAAMFDGFNEIVDNGLRNVKRSLSIQHSSKSSTSSDSVAFMSPENSHMKEMSPFSCSSSSEYEIEYLDKTQLLQSQQNVSEDECYSEIEWITNEEYEEMMRNKQLSNTSFSSSPTDSCSSSDYSLNDIEWVEGRELDQLSDQYLRI